LALITTTGACCRAGDLAQPVEVRVVLEAVLGDVGDEHRRLGGDEAERLQHRLLLLAEGDGAHRPGLVERGAALLEHVDQALGFLVVARLGDLDRAGERLLDGGEVGEAELGLDHLDVRHRVDLAGDVDHVLVLEAADDVDDRVGLAHVGEELVAEAFALGRAGHQAGDVDELDDRRDDALRLDDRRQLAEARIGQLDHADVRLDGAERDSSRGDACLGEGVEEGGLADVGQSHDAAFQAHGGGVSATGKGAILVGDRRALGRAPGVARPGRGFENTSTPSSIRDQRRLTRSRR
jgi:hypothetical protein